MNNIEDIAGLPSFVNDQKADAWLRLKSPFYDSMATQVEGHGGYEFCSWEQPLGTVVHASGSKCIYLNDNLKGGERLSILIFEMTNAFQSAKHLEIDERTRSGAIDTAEVFALRHELIEYDGLRYHRKVLSELDPSIGGIPREMLTWINPQLTTLASYSLPLAHDYLECQDQGGHTDHYRKHFPICAGTGGRDELAE